MSKRRDRNELTPDWFDGIEPSAPIPRAAGSASHTPNTGKSDTRTPRTITDAQLYEQFLSDKDVARRYGVVRQTIWRWVKRNRGFPKPIMLAPVTSRWKLSELLYYEQVSGPDLKTNSSNSGGGAQ